MSPQRVAVWVSWVDSSHRQGWHDLESYRIPIMNVETLGWLISEDQEQITIALSGVFDGTSSHPIAHLICIPQCSIKDRRKIDL